MPSLLFQMDGGMIPAFHLEAPLLPSLSPPSAVQKPSRLEESPGGLIRPCLPNLQPPATLCLCVSVFMFNLFLLNFK